MCQILGNFDGQRMDRNAVVQVGIPVLVIHCFHGFTFGVFGERKD
jgi:hypothetical protein